ncbi:hypothetical protein PHBOTO_002434 [Pseudozyma hubeiensis]|nr:hypothetical protein PHBOTO_002434 [Pseudozyma hubeiensis]
MNKKLIELRRTLAEESSAASTPSRSPQWLARLLESTPGLPSDAVPHNRPNHADLQGVIAEASFHPAMEACLHLINGDLYSAHFLVRKAQGGSRYLDWLHAILHKLEGDFRNAKMWYTDLGNNNADKDHEASSEERQSDEAPIFDRFRKFWFVPAANGGAGERIPAKSLSLQDCDSLPEHLKLTAHGHTDLVFLSTLSRKAASTKAVSGEFVAREMEKHHSTTTLAEDKIRDSQSAFSLDELKALYENVSPEAVGDVTQLELIWMLKAMVNDFGWRQLAMADAVQALKVESTPAHQKVDDDRKEKASNMVFNPGQGQRKF